MRYKFRAKKTKGILNQAILKSKLRKISDQFYRKGRVLLQKEIISALERGTSPVAGVKARFEPYTESYKKQIKRIPGKSVRPVNLKVTGKLHDSLFFKKKPRSFIVGFNNFLADIHNRLGPAGRKDKVRRMLPTRDGETFKRNILRKIRDLLEEITKKTLK